MIALPSMNLWKMLFFACSSSTMRLSALLYLVQHNSKKHVNTLRNSPDYDCYNSLYG